MVVIRKIALVVGGLFLIVVIILLVLLICTLCTNKKSSRFSSLEELGYLLCVPFFSGDNDVVVIEHSIVTEKDSTKIQFLLRIPSDLFNTEEYSLLHENYHSRTDGFHPSDVSFINQGGFGVDKSIISYVNMSYSEFVVKILFGEQYRPYPIYLYIVENPEKHGQEIIMLSTIIPYQLKCKL